MDSLSKAISIIGGLEATGRVCGVSGKAVRKWLKGGLPRTEWTGETSYATKIEQATGGAVTRGKLLDEHKGRVACQCV